MRDVAQILTENSVAVGFVFPTVTVRVDGGAVPACRRQDGQHGHDRQQTVEEAAMTASTQRPDTLLSPWLTE